MDDQLYEIEAGVRRAKAAWLCGHDTIAARIGGIGEVVQVAIKNLRSPKMVIEDGGPRGASWGVIYCMTRRGQELPPIDVVPGNFGTPIADVEVQADELELFRQRHSAMHKVIIKARFLAYKNTDPQILARILDHADPLGFMLMDDFQPEGGEDLPSLFRCHLQEIEEKFDGFSGLVTSLIETWAATSLSVNLSPLEIVKTNPLS